MIRLPGKLSPETPLGLPVFVGLVFSRRAELVSIESPPSADDVSACYRESWSATDVECDYFEWAI